MITRPHDELLDLPSVRQPSASMPSSPMAVSSAPPESPIEMVMDRLRGRWRIAIVLGLLLGGVLAVAGYRLTPVYYESYAVVHIAQTGTTILEDVTPWDTRLPNFHGVIKMHQFWMTSPRVISGALRDPAVAELPLSRQPDAQGVILGNLSTWSESGSELISITYRSETGGHEAQTIVNAIVDSYYEAYGQGGDSVRRRQLKRLYEEKEGVRRERTLLQQQINAAAYDSDYPTIELEGLIQGKLEDIEDLKRQIQRTDLRIQARGDSGEPGRLDLEDGGPTDDELAAIEPQLHSLWQAQIREQIELDLLLARYSENHATVQTARRRVEVLERRIIATRNDAERRWRKAGGPVNRRDTDRPLSLPELRDLRKSLGETLTRVQNDLRSITEQQSTLKSMTDKLRRLDERYDEVERTVEIMRLQDTDQLAGAVTIMERPLAPGVPSKDRRKVMAAAGFGGGMVFSLGLFFMLGTLDRRAFSASQLRQLPSGLRVLGVLPDLRTRRVDAELSATATQCVHQIRNRIEAARSPMPSFVLLVTSPFQGDGKTSVAMALGWSYAAAGHRTVLVDCDFLGHSLTRQMGAAGLDGVKEVLQRRQLNSEILEMPVRNLSVLGAGNDENFGPESIRRDDFGMLCAELRQQYDVVILDSGPSIGSVELLPVAAAANGVVFSMRRGRPRTRFEECLVDLDSVNVPCLGVILNCADQSDCKRYVSRSTVSQRADTISKKQQQRGNALVKVMGRNSNGE